MQGWQVARNATGFIVEDPVRFPSGMRALAGAIHEMGLSFGLYTSATSLTCQGRPGSYQMEREDALSYCAFGIDYIKVVRSQPPPAPPGPTRARTLSHLPNQHTTQNLLAAG